VENLFKTSILILFSFITVTTLAQACAENEITIAINFDDYGGETTWQLTDSNGAVIVTGNGYSYYFYEYYTYYYGYNNAIATICIPDGCYDFTIEDDYGDGICCYYGIGNYSLTDSDGNILASGGEFTYSETTNFCLQSNNCPQILNITGLIAAATYQADDSIFSNGQVESNSGGPVFFQAGANGGEFIALEAGFIADGTVNFEAVNIQCDFTD